MAAPRRFFADYWQIHVTIAVLLVNIGTNLAMLNSIKEDVQSLKAQVKDNRDQNVLQDLKLKELDLKNASLDTRVTTTEAIQRTDHDAVVRMVDQVNRIAQWVDRQETAKPKP